MATFNKYNILGVINVTPNSFSDAGINFQKINLKNTVQQMLKCPGLILDIGFESTAPMNCSISKKIEVERFSFFINSIKGLKNLKFISIDSYKIQNYLYFYFELKKINPKIKVIFNDVSGVVDCELMDILKKMPDCYYVYCATRIKERSEIHSHGKIHLLNTNIIDEINYQFKSAIKLFTDNQLEQKLILDPGFGFSKTFDENWELINNFKNWSGDLKFPLLIGISKKSFLYKMIEPGTDREQTEFFHIELLSEFLKIRSKNIIFRVHDPHIVDAALKLTFLA